MKSIVRTALPAALFAILLPAAVAGQTTAWSGKDFQIDAPGVVSRSNVILGQPNLLAKQALPMGNGRLGAAVWSADGFTAQLNRADTLPRRLSPGQVVIPGDRKSVV